MEILQISDLHLRGDGKLSFRKVDTPACLRTAAAYLHALNRHRHHRRPGRQR